MVDRKRTIVLVILLVVIGVSAWSKLRFINEKSYEPQRWRADEFPTIRKE